LVNQFVGYTLLRYPWTFNSVGWGIALGAATLLASLAARWIYRLQRAIPSALRFAAVFAVAFSVFEGRSMPQRTLFWAAYRTSHSVLFGMFLLSTPFHL